MSLPSYAPIYPTEEGLSDARHRTVPGDPGVAGPVDGGERGPGREGQQVVVRVEAGAVSVPGMRDQRPSVRQQAAPLAPSGHLPVHHLGIEANVPRVNCPSHGVRQLRVPWAEPGSQFTALFERLAIDLLRECAVTGAAGLAL